MYRTILPSGTLFKYEEYQTGDPERVIFFIHGANQTSFCWRRMISNLDMISNTLFVSLNLTGFGKSIPKYIPHTEEGKLEHCIIDLNLFYHWYKTQHPGITSYHVTAFSFGTYITLSWYLQFRPQLASLVLCAPYGLVKYIGKYGYLLGFLFKYKILWFVYKTLEYIKAFFRLHIHKYIVSENNYSYDMISSTFHWSLQTYYVKNPMANSLKDIDIPIHTVYSDNDYISPAGYGRLFYPDLVESYTILPGTSHVFIRDDAFKDLFVKFFQNHDHRSQQG